MSTIITAYYNVNSKFDNSIYIKWIENFFSPQLSIKKIVLFTNESTFKDIKHLIPKKHVKVIFLELSEFIVEKYSKALEYSLSIDPNKKHSIDLYKIWLEKPFFVERVVKLNPFNTKYFTWCDIGYFRENERLHLYAGFQRIFLEKVSFLYLDDYLETDFSNKEIDNRFQKRKKYHIGGGLFTGNKENMQTFCKDYKEILDICIHKPIYCGNDQYIYNFVYLIKGNINLIKASPKCNNDNRWFYFAEYLSKFSI